ncbi:unnamed protein product [Lupinus luteus]|uniref:Uncharacterized protein n=1 Tax=Lupinus luteus TaxID=3873 RepID=A0AAV1X706_LUPLU
MHTGKGTYDFMTQMRAESSYGDCRKNRRSNKNLRESIDSLTFKNSPCNNPIEYSYDPRRTSCSSSSVVSTCGPNIDLALVYANFLNQKPDSRAEVENQDQVHAVFDPSIENSRLCNKQIGPSSMLPEELALSACFNLPEHSCTGSHFCDGNSPIYFRGFNSMKIHHEARIEQCNNHHDAISFELPPLPGEEEVSHDMMWTNSEIMVNNAFQATQSPLFGPNSHDDANLLMGNWSPFNLPRDASFPKP